MLRSMYSAIGGMKAQQTKLDVIANNIANVGTTGFKSSKVNFSDTLYQSSSKATGATTTTGGTNAKSVGLGAKVSSINKLMTTGNALSTGRTLDNCIDGDGYYIVAEGGTADTIGVTATTGAYTGTSTVDKVYYTRDGNFSLDEDGYLLTSSGLRVMGYYATGNQITASTTGTNIGSAQTGASPVTTTGTDTLIGTNLQALAIPDSIGTGTTAKKVESFSIGTDGVITVTAGESKYVVGQIAMATFTNPEGLEDIGGNLLQVSTNSGDPVVRSTADDTTATNNSGAFGKVKSGYLEASNVDLTEQFTDMISATRSFQAASKMISNGDEILQTITGLIR